MNTVIKNFKDSLPESLYLGDSNFPVSVTKSLILPLARTEAGKDGSLTITDDVNQLKIEQKYTGTKCDLTFSDLGTGKVELQVSYDNGKLVKGDVQVKDDDAQEVSAKQFSGQNVYNFVKRFSDDGEETIHDIEEDSEAENEEILEDENAEAVEDEDAVKEHGLNPMKLAKKAAPAAVVAGTVGGGAGLAAAATSSKGSRQSAPASTGSSGSGYGYGNEAKQQTYNAMLAAGLDPTEAQVKVNNLELNKHNYDKAQADKNWVQKNPGKTVGIGAAGVALAAGAAIAAKKLKDKKKKEQEAVKKNSAQDYLDDTCYEDMYDADQVREHGNPFAEMAHNAELGAKNQIPGATNPHYSNNLKGKFAQAKDTASSWIKKNPGKTAGIAAAVGAGIGAAAMAAKKKKEQEEKERAKQHSASDVCQKGINKIFGKSHAGEDQVPDYDEVDSVNDFCPVCGQYPCVCKDIVAAADYVKANSGIGMGATRRFNAADTCQKGINAIFGTKRHAGEDQVIEDVQYDDCTPEDIELANVSEMSSNLLPGCRITSMSASDVCQKGINNIFGKKHSEGDEIDPTSDEEEEYEEEAVTEIPEGEEAVEDEETIKEHGGLFGANRTSAQNIQKGINVITGNKGVKQHSYKNVYRYVK